MTRTWMLSASLVLAGLSVGVPAGAQWETPNRGFHKDTGFPLEGRHLGVPQAFPRGSPHSWKVLRYFRYV